MPPDSARWRPMERGDLAGVAAIADALHTLVERAEIFDEKFGLYPRGCFALERGGALVGYGLCHPWRRNAIPPLDAYLHALPAAPDCLYLHDVAILPAGRGQGCAAQLVARIVAVARDEAIDTLTLVSVYGTVPLWTQLGFAVVADRRFDVKLQPYGPAARYMTRTIA